MAGHADVSDCAEICSQGPGHDGAVDVTTGRALERVLDTVAAEAPEAVARGRAALSRVAGEAPVELAWRPGQPGLFWIAEPAARALPRELQIERALEIVESIGGSMAVADRQAATAAAQASPERWPVRIAGRYTAQGDTAKLYVLVGEVPASFQAVLPLLRGTDRPKMIGLTPQGEREFYWTRPTRSAGDLWRLRSDPASAPFAEALDAALVDWTGSGVDDEAGGRLRLSLRYDASGQPDALTAYCRVKAAGGGLRVRIRLLARGGNDNPALARCWADGELRPLLLSLASSATGISYAVGLT